MSDDDSLPSPEPSMPFAPTALSPTTASRQKKITSLAQLDQATQNSVIAALFRREPLPQIASNAGISERQLRRVHNNLRAHGTFLAPQARRMGRPSCLTKEVEAELRAYVSESPLAMLGEMKEWLEKKYPEIKVSRASLSRRMKEMGFVRAMVKRGIRTRDQPLPLEVSDKDWERVARERRALEMDEEERERMGEVRERDPAKERQEKRGKYAWLIESKGNADEGGNDSIKKEKGKQKKATPKAGQKRKRAEMDAAGEGSSLVAGGAVHQQDQVRANEQVGEQLNLDDMATPEDQDEVSRQLLTQLDGDDGSSPTPNGQHEHHLNHHIQAHHVDSQLRHFADDYMNAQIHPLPLLHHSRPGAPAPRPPPQKQSVYPPLPQQTLPQQQSQSPQQSYLALYAQGQDYARAGAMH